ncbi:unnamed protein product [Clavelina lepadiformis]|uniref:Endoglucanase n=1 Tax=Clavelina lepadiformis TaxID=159417 RepID=A0ABP0FN20_CLALP
MTLNFLKLFLIVGCSFSGASAESCFFCNGESSNEVCNQNTQTCPNGDQGSCMNEIRVHSGIKRITKLCKQTQACEGQTQQNANTCNSGTENSVCYYCCQGNLCNLLEDASEPALSTSMTTSEVTRAASTESSTTPSSAATATSTSSVTTKSSSPTTTSPTTTSSTTTTSTSTNSSSFTAMSPPSTTSSTTTMSTTTSSTTTTTTTPATTLSTTPFAPQTECEPLNTPRYGDISCTEGSSDRSRCTVTCDEDYALRAGTNRNRRCRCLSSGVCSWSGVEAVCDYDAETPISCDVPDMMRASFGMVDVWPMGGVARVTVKPTQQTTNGWSFALMFARSLPEGVRIESGHVSLVAMSEDRRILTFQSLDHVKDISNLESFTLYMCVRNVPVGTDPSMYAALVGFYPMLVRDASCIQDISPLRPLPTTTPPPTASSSTSRPASSTRSTTTTTRRTTTTTRPTTTTTTTTTTTAPPPPPPPSGDCEVVQPPDQYRILNPGWNANDGWKFTSRAEKVSDGKGALKDWVIKLEFDNGVKAIEVHVADADGPHQNGLVWLLRPKSWNDGNGENVNDLMVFFTGTLYDGSAAPNAIMTFCRNGAEPGMTVTGGDGFGGGAPTTTTTMAPTPAPTVSSSAGTTTTVSPNFLARCSSSARASFGSLPSRSAQTDPSGFQRSTVPSDFDYNEVLHKSLLFYEAQRSGNLPANNRIPWRGDSGLKHGCDVGIDLTGGWYDAGDNIKFGFPMAYSATVLAWGMIEFKDAYVDSGDWDAALETLKWATDYFVKAHTARYELYVQVGDGGNDHGRWLRPEDIDYIQESFKIDQNNPGTEVAAETAAALAAASIVFQNEDLAYSRMLLSHAYDLYSFADLFRKNYHLSVPGVEVYYKSWSGFNDELLWSAAWLYKASGLQRYLDAVESRYSSYGGSNLAPEFSWDNKYPGVQVLMAQITDKQSYKDDVYRFLNRAINDVHTTPNGLTWQSQWGANRYAANFAFIAITAAKVIRNNPNEGRYIDYAFSQIDYMLGQGSGRSFVVGFGNNPPRSPHHRASSCPNWTRTPVQACGFDSLHAGTPNPHILYGALVGGPDDSDNYEDDRSNFINNEVATDYNAGFQSAVAGLQSYLLDG